MLDIESHEEIHPMFEIRDINLAKILDKDYTIVKEDKESLEKLLNYLLKKLMLLKMNYSKN